MSCPVLERAPEEQCNGIMSSASHGSGQHGRLQGARGMRIVLVKEFKVVYGKLGVT